MNELTLKARLKDPDRQRFFVTYLAGKMAGLILAVGLIFSIGTLVVGEVAHAQDDTAAQLTSVINATNTAWVLVAAFLVFFMQAGFMMLEAGFARTREVVNILQECIVDTCLCAILFWAFGFAFMFGKGNGFIGHEFFFLNGAPDTYTYGGSFERGSPSWRSSCSSSRSPTRAPPSRPGRWSAARRSRVTSSTASW